MEKQAKPRSEKNKQLTLRLTEELHKEVKIRAAEEGLSMTDLLERLLKEYLERKG